MEALALADRVLLLDGGRAVQEGPPDEIYDHPKTLFAAEFMGSNNRLPGRIAELRGSRARITSNEWELWGELQADKKVGDDATAVVRLERVRIADHPGENLIPASLESAVYLGERWDHLLRVGGVRVRAWTRDPPPPAPHFLNFPAPWVWVF